MAQPSVAHYFNTRKRSAVDDHKVDSARKVLILDSVTSDRNGEANCPDQLKKVAQFSHVPTKIASLESRSAARKIIKVGKSKLVAEQKQDIKTFIGNMKVLDRCVTPPNLVEKDTNKELDEIKKKLCRSSKLTELKASINTFNKSAEQLKALQKKSSDLQKSSTSKQLKPAETTHADISQSPKLKSFKSIEFEVVVSPQKTYSPEKQYLSPKKESSVRRNLLNALSPTKSSFSTVLDSCSKDVPNDATKQGLKLPFKYRTLAEIFRAVDTVSQILYNRKEIITFHKLKPAVEEMIKKNLTQKHLAQINFLYPDAYHFCQKKLKQFEIGSRQEKWQLVLTPNFDETENMTSEILLNRRRKLYDTLVNLVKDYHNEFLLSLTPPMIIAKDKITRWHPEFDLEKIPDVEQSSIPEPPVEETLTTGKDVLEKARQLFNCNTRMEQALEKLKAARTANPPLEQESQPISILKGIPKSLLEKVRQKQAAKALVSMTRSADKDKEVQMYSRLPEIARLTRNLFVTEKKGVLELETVIDKLGNSYRCFLNKSEVEDHLKAIAIEVPGWLAFHKLRHSMFLKLAKNADLSAVLSKLEKVAKEKNEK